MRTNLMVLETDYLTDDEVTLVIAEDHCYGEHTVVGSMTTTRQHIVDILIGFYENAPPGDGSIEYRVEVIGEPS